MAAGTPTIIYPAGSETGIRTECVLVALKNPYSGAGTQRECRWQLANDSGFGAGTIVWDSLLRENDDREQGDDWVEIPMPLIPAARATVYYLRCLVRNTSGESSSNATAVSFTTESATVTSTTWGQAQ